jgi:hypothetical protein
VLPFFSRRIGLLNDLYLVLSRGWDRRESDNRYIPSFDKGSAKLQYTFRL